MKVERLEGLAREAALADLARLRIAVFRDWPYLYDGDPAYEETYLRAYHKNPNAVLAVARDGDTIVGAATGMPLGDHEDAAQLAGAPGLPPVETIFYCAESVLLPAYRGRGLGHGFFDVREAAARAQGFSHCLFCGVVRPDDHPAKPEGHRPLDGFWAKRGYSRCPGVTVTFHWKDIDAPEETPHTLQAWMRAL